MPALGARISEAKTRDWIWIETVWSPVEQAGRSCCHALQFSTEGDEIKVRLQDL